LNHRVALRIVILTLLVGTLSCAGPGKKPPNVILISVDTLRADHVGCYGASFAATPTMDRLASEGLLFESCFSAVPITLPSHCTMMTGLYPLHHSVRDNGTFSLPEEIPTLATILKSQGYATLGVIGAYPLTSRFGLSRGFDVWDEELKRTTDGVLPLFFDERKADRVTQRTIEVLDSVGDLPFFLFVHYFDAHHPWNPPESLRLRYLDLPYDGEIAFVDLWLGKLIEYLEGRGILENSILVLTGDHGEGLMEHGEMSHSLLLYNGTMHVPLIFRAPGIEAGVTDRPVSLADIMPTVLEILDLPLPGPVDGRSLLDKPAEDRDLYLETLTGRLTHGWNDMRGLIEGRWKYILGPEPELYDLENDFKETENLASQEKERTARMDARLREIILTSGPHSLRDRFRCPDDEVRAKLQALGYLSGSDFDDDLAELGPITQEGDPRRHTSLIEIISAARERVGRGDFLGAIAILDDARRSQPDDAEILRQLANAAVFAQDYDRAIDACNILLQRPEKDPSVYFLAAVAFKGAGDVDAALARIDEALELKPGDPQMLLVKARILSDRGDGAGAVGVLADALERAPCGREFLIELAKEYRKAGKKDAMRKAYERMLICDPSDAVALYNLGNMELEGGKLGAAEARYRAAIEADPGYPAGHYGLALVLRENNHLSEASREAERAMECAGVHSTMGRRATELLEDIADETCR